MTTSGPSDAAAFARALTRAAPGLRRELPWVAHGDPWAVYVAEVMLQQTPTTRVIEPWRRFLARFPSPRACADAPLAEVLAHWRGLGYPRRAKALHDASVVMRDQFEAAVPADPAHLRRLPGVGPYTANAVAAFAYGARVAVLDTNVGRVLARAVANAVLTPAQARSSARDVLARRDPARHNQAMIDLGAQFCRARPRCEHCPVASACRWRREGGPDPAPASAAVSRPQAPYAGSRRELRGAVLRALGDGPLTVAALAQRLGEGDAARLEDAIASLALDGLVQRARSRYRLAGS